MGKPTVTRLGTLAEITAALAELLGDYELKPNDERQAREDLARQRLCRLVRPNEAAELLRIFKAERIACAHEGCGQVVPRHLAAGDLCQWCVAKAAPGR